MAKAYTWFLEHEGTESVGPPPPPTGMEQGHTYQYVTGTH